MGRLSAEARARRTRQRPSAIDLASFPAGTRTDVTLDFFEDGVGAAIGLPIIVVRGRAPGPALGLTAAVHGDELNGIRVIHELLAQVDPNKLRGSLVCCPVVNVPAYLDGTRRFRDGSDLNHSFPGKWRGRLGDQYAKRFAAVFLPAIDALVDLHTASEGRINSFYVRADLKDPGVQRLALLMSPDIVLHARGGDGTLRNAARLRGVSAITAEVGNPRVIQRSMVGHAVVGLHNILRSLGMTDGPIVEDDEPVVCGSSEWLYTTTGGLLTTEFGLLDRVAKGQRLAVTRDLFGHVTAEYNAPRDGIVIGMARNPVAVPGTRFCHLGAPKTALADTEFAQ